MKMQDFLLMFINQYGTQILYAVLSVCAAAIGTWIGKLYKEKVNDDTKRKIVKTCCTAVEQLYKDIGGDEKFAMACKYIEEMLAEKGITITDLEMQMLIEEVCYDFAHAVREEIEQENEPNLIGFAAESNHTEEPVSANDN